MSKCRLCGAEVRFVKMPSGSMMPVDPDPHTDGNVAVWGIHGVVVDVWKPGKYERAKQALCKGIDAPFHFHRSHFATCPKRSEAS